MLPCLRFPNNDKILSHSFGWDTATIIRPLFVITRMDNVQRCRNFERFMQW